MRYLDESLAGLAAYALGWRVRRDQLGMLRFEVFELLGQLVEFEVADFGLVEDEIEIFVMTNQIAEGLDLLLDVFCRHH